MAVEVPIEPPILYSYLDGSNAPFSAAARERADILVRHAAGDYSDGGSSFSLPSLSSIAGLGGGLPLGLITALLRPPRLIGPIIAGVTIEEQASDELEITNHPVEAGAAITDHAFKRPCEVIIRCGWTDSGHFAGFARIQYAALLALQLSRIPLIVSTGKRLYVNMLIASITQTTNATIENALIATIVCRQIIIVQTQVVKVAPLAQQGQPAATATTAPTPDKAPTTAPTPPAAASSSGWFGNLFRSLVGPAAPAAGAAPAAAAAPVVAAR